MTSSTPNRRQFLTGGAAAAGALAAGVPLGSEALAQTSGLAGDAWAKTAPANEEAKEPILVQAGHEYPARFHGKSPRIIAKDILNNFSPRDIADNIDGIGTDLAKLSRVDSRKFGRISEAIAKDLGRDVAGWAGELREDIGRGEFTTAQARIANMPAALQPDMVALYNDLAENAGDQKALTRIAKDFIRRQVPDIVAPLAKAYEQAIMGAAGLRRRADASGQKVAPAAGQQGGMRLTA